MLTVTDYALQAEAPCDEDKYAHRRVDYFTTFCQSEKLSPGRDV